MKDTFVPSQNYVTKKWYVINAENQTLGRLATKISTILTGKKKISYTPFLETGDTFLFKIAMMAGCNSIYAAGSKDFSFFSPFKNNAYLLENN